MPIHLPQFQPKLACTGRIKNGMNVRVTDRDGRAVCYDDGRPKYRPQQLDYFLITTNVRDKETGNFVVDEAVMKELRDAGIADADGQIRKLPGYLHSDEIEEVCATSLAWYDGKVARCRGDGEKAMRWKIERGARVGEPQEIECTCEQWENGNCKAHAIFRMRLALPRAITLGSLYEYRTTSKIGIPQITGGLMHIQEEIGTIVRVPIWLVLKPQLVNPPGQAQKTVHVPFVHLRGDDIMTLRQQAIASKREAEHVHAVAGRRLLLGLPAPGDENEDEDEQEAVAKEFKDDKDGESEFYDVSYTEAKKQPGESTTPVGTTTITTSTQPATGTGGVGSTETKPGAERMTAPGTPPPSAAPAAASAPADPPDLKAPLSSLPADASQRVRLPRLLTKLAELRGAQGDDLDKMRKKILAEATQAAGGQAVLYKDLSIGMAEAVIALLEKGIAAIALNKSDRDEPVDDDSIPP